MERRRWRGTQRRGEGRKRVKWGEERTEERGEGSGREKGREETKVNLSPSVPGQRVPHSFQG